MPCAALYIRPTELIYPLEYRLLRCVLTYVGSTPSNRPIISASGLSCTKQWHEFSIHHTNNRITHYQSTSQQ